MKNPLKVTGKPIVYKDANGQPCSYHVADGLGPPFLETMLPGVANDPSGKRDALFLVNHGAGGTLPLARESAGTLRLADTPTALTFNAELDPSSNLASDLASAIARKDLTQMSVGFRVLSDSWSEDYMNRTVRAIELLDVSPVNQPASPTTSISLVPSETAKKKKLDDEYGGPDGTQNAPYPNSYMGGDGTGTRDKSRWSNAERRAGARAGGIEQRANLAGTLEVRAFTVWVPSPEVVVPVVAPVKKRNDALMLERDLMQLRRHGLQLRGTAKYSDAQKQAMLKTGHALLSPATGKASFPIKDAEDVKNAVKAVPLGAADDAGIRKHIIKNAAKIGASHLIPPSWNADGSLKQSNSATETV